MSFSDFSWHKMRRPTSRQIDIDAYWSVPTHKLLATLGTAAQGLTLRKARLRLKRHDPNLLEAKKKNKTTVDLVVSQFKNPLVLILIIASIMSLVAAEWRRLSWRAIAVRADLGLTPTDVCRSGGFLPTGTSGTC